MKVAVTSRYAKLYHVQNYKVTGGLFASLLKDV